MRDMCNGEWAGARLGMAMARLDYELLSRIWMRSAVGAVASGYSRRWGY